MNDPKRWYETRGQPEGWAWAWAMLKASPRVVSLAIPFNTSTQVSKLVKRLRDVQTTLRSLTIQSTTRYKPSRPLVLELLASAPNLTLNTLHLAHLAYESATDRRNTTVRIPAETSEGISVISIQGLATISQQLLPASSSTLRALELSVGSLQPSNVDDLLQHFGHQLETLKLGIEGGAYWPEGLGSYGRYHEGFSLDTSIFTLLPVLETLELRYCKSLSLARLNELSRHSPNVRHLSFAESVWTCDPPAMIVDAILPELDLNRILETWSDLRSVDLGVVPLASRKRYDLIRASATRRGCRLDYRTCSPRCWSCGMYH